MKGAEEGDMGENGRGQPGEDGEIVDERALDGFEGDERCGSEDNAGGSEGRLYKSESATSDPREDEGTYQSRGLHVHFLPLEQREPPSFCDGTDQRHK